ncbi:hypothetical protein C4E44_27465, partial [Pseudomonas sp. MWU12-2312b]
MCASGLLGPRSANLRTAATPRLAAFGDGSIWSTAHDQAFAQPPGHRSDFPGRTRPRPSRPLDGRHQGHTAHTLHPVQRRPRG